MMILHCTECNNPLNITAHRGSYCLQCEFTPSMQDTYFKEIISKKEYISKMVDLEQKIIDK